MMFPKKGRKRAKAGRLPALDAKLWRIFAKYIRRRDCPDGWGTCISCGSPKQYADLQAGHFIGRRYKATKFHEQNVHAQCVSCNKYNSGRAYEYSLAIDRKYGAGTAETLYNLSRMRGSRLDRLWYEDAIQRYTEKLKALEGS